MFVEGEHVFAGKRVIMETGAPEIIGILRRSEEGIALSFALVGGAGATGLAGNFGGAHGGKDKGNKGDREIFAAFSSFFFLALLGPPGQSRLGRDGGGHGEGVGMVWRG